MESNNSDGDISDSELATCEMPISTYLEGDRSKETKQKCVIKRKTREDKDNEDEEFTTVTKRKSKRIERVPQETEEQHNNERTSVKDLEYYEVCVTSLEYLPKQMALAKLLRTQNIRNITRIKYKSPFKVLIQFKQKEDALLLMSCKKLTEMGVRCQLMSELSLSYGVVKGVDLDLTEEEIIKILESTIEVLSIKRLKRLNADGKWIDSESTTNKNKSHHEEAIIEETQGQYREEEIQNANRNEEVLHKLELKKILLRLKNIILSENTFEEKCILVFKVIVDEFKKNVINVLLRGGMLESVINLFNG
ncbi:unnamed protein product [Parnassius mnemosyne]|uniref:Uncharacterized protein n=1 Tax=Parnassius mnemosyne TaxID=213953 RepID=A0AAV1KCD6_9NEOP